jgi:GT2 family glycosyltransferase
MDICVVTYRNDAERIAGALRPGDRLRIRDNTHDNIGFAAAANLLAEQGDDELIVFVNPDGNPWPGCFDALERAFDDPDVVGCEPDYGPSCVRTILDETGGVEWLMGACMAVRRKDFEAVGGFDERLFMYCEDLDLSWKLAARGTLRQVPDARYDHDHDGSARPWLAMHRNFRNLIVVQRRHHRLSPADRLRDLKASVVGRHWRRAAAQITGAGDYLIRARRWT